MKKKINLFILILLAYLPLKACDICGCGVGSYYLGILPEFNKKFMGLRYQYKTLETHLGPTGNRTPLTTDETYQSMEIWGGMNIGKKFRVLGFIPYNFIKKDSPSAIDKKDGLGDIAFMGYYNLFDKKTTINSKILVQSLWFGAGVKLPTGKYENTGDVVGTNSLNVFQLGTASTDFTVNAAYDIRLMDFGINTNANYKINTENKYGYRYGNKFTINGLAYYKFKINNNATIAPNFGILYENSVKDVEHNKYDIETSGGYSTSLVMGTEASFKKISFGANFQKIASQDLANGRAKAGNRFMIHVSKSF